MAVAVQPARTDFKHPINVGSKEFAAKKFEIYKWLREESPVYKGKIAVISGYFVSPYTDCVDILKDPRYVRNRATARGKGGRTPFPLPKSIQAIAKSMITEDEPGHTRLRDLVQKAFTPRALSLIEGRIESMTHELLDAVEPQGTVDLMQAYSLPIPVEVIRGMVGVSDEDMPRFRGGLKVLSEGMTGWSIFRSLFWDLKRTVKMVEEMIEKKRSNPGDDILTGLIEAEESGDRLSEDELIAMVFLLIFAGFETTVHLITNGVLTLLQHPDQLARLRAHPELMESAVEEILRFAGPIHGTKPNWATEEITLHGVTIPKGAAVMPLLGGANRDPDVFENPEVFDIARTPNRHIAFGFGPHVCLGAALARMETKVALTTLLNRNPNLRLAVDPSELRVQNMPLWHRYESLPVTFG